MERLYDFEEECAEGLMQQKLDESLKKTDVRVKSVLDMMDEVRSKMEDLERWETLTQESSHSVEVRLQKLEDIAQNSSNQLTVIHRFMTSQNQSESNAENTSGLSDIASENESKTDLGPLNDLEPIASYSSGEENAVNPPNVIIKGGNVLVDSTLVQTKQMNLENPSLPESILATPSKEWIEDAKAMSTSNAKGLSETVEDANQNAIEGERVRFHIDRQLEEYEENDEAGNSLSLQCPGLSVSLTNNGESINTSNLKPGPSKNQKRKISKASSGKVDVSFKQHTEKPKLSTKEKKRHESAESRDSIEFRAVMSALPDEKHLQRRTRRFTESSAGARTSEDDNIVSQQSARRRASRMENPVVGKLLGRQKRIGDLYDIAKDCHPRKRLSTSKDSQEEDFKEQQISSRNYYRSQSEITPGLPLTFNMQVTRDSKTSYSEEISESSESEIGNQMQRLPVFPMNRKITSRKQRRDYTSITDQLEEMIPVIPNTRSESKSPKPDLPAIEIEAKCLHDAEETDYNLMETIIEQRLRRDSHNLAVSLEELVTKSIRDESSTTSSSSSSTSSCSPGESDSEYSNSSKHNLQIQQNERVEDKTPLKNVETKKMFRKNSALQQRKISMGSKQATQDTKKHKSKTRKKSAKKKNKSNSKISLASLEIVENQLETRTAICSPNSVDKTKTDQISESQNQIINADVPNIGTAPK